jgi:uncharacterized membrane protein
VRSGKALLVAVAGAVYALVGLVRHWHFGSSAYDLGIYDQMVWHLSRFEAPASTVHGLSNMLGDHFSPIWMLVAPLYWLRSAPETLIVAQAAALALSILPVWAFLARRLDTNQTALLSAAYASFWGLQRAAQFDVHELAFAPLFIAIMLLGIDDAGRPGRNPWRLFLMGAVPLIFVKEDQIPLVAAACALLAWKLRDQRQRVIALGAAGASVAIFLLVVRVVIPGFNDAGVYNFTNAFDGAMSNPFGILKQLVTPVMKLETVAAWLLPFLFLPLRSSFGWLIVPLALERFLSSSVNHWGTSFHYTAPLAPILAMAAGDALSRTRVHFGAWAMLLFCLVLPGRQPVWKLFSPDFWGAPEYADTAARALTFVPPDASVAAQAAIVPHLSQRASIMMLTAEGKTANADADVVVSAPSDLSPWPFASAEAVKAHVETYKARGYRTVFSENGWEVLRR